MSKIIEHDDVRPLLNLNRKDEKWELYLIRNKSYKVISVDLEQYVIDNVRRDFIKGIYEFKICQKFDPLNPNIKIGYCKYNGMVEWEFAVINADNVQAEWIEDENKVACLFFNVFSRYFDKQYTSSEEARNEEKIEKILSENYYKDNAHFIYELMQNADDAEAKNIYFELYSDKIVIHHDGEKRFDISQPSYYYDEKEQLEDTLAESGCVNAISLIMQSNKKGKNTIGRFGIGFKSVYAFTKNPLICDGVWYFKLRGILGGIEVVEQPDEYKEWIEKGETVFELPFNLSRRKALQCVEEIIKQFERLVHPTLFLRSLDNIYLVNHTQATGKVCYSLTRKIILVKEDFKIEEVEYNDANNGKNCLYVSSANVKNADVKGIKTIKIAFAINKETGAITSLEEKEQIYCYFPTKEESKLGFLIHAPFLLTENRENIEMHDEYNILLINELANLACRTIEELCQKCTIDDEVLNIVAYDRVDKNDNIRYKFYEKFIETFKNKKIIPTGEKGIYINSKQAFWVAQIYRDIFRDALPKESSWCFVSVLQSERGNPKFDFVCKVLEKNCWRGDFITSSFCESLNMQTLAKFYQVILDNNLIEDYRRRPIWKTENKGFMAAYDGDGGKARLFQPTTLPHLDSCICVHNDFAGCQPAIILMKKIGIQPLSDEVEEIERTRQSVFGSGRYSTNNNACKRSLSDSEHIRDWQRIAAIQNWEEVFSRELKKYHIYGYRRFSGETGYCSCDAINATKDSIVAKLLSFVDPNVDVRLLNDELYSQLDNGIRNKIELQLKKINLYDSVNVNMLCKDITSFNRRSELFLRHVHDYKWHGGPRYRYDRYAYYYTLKYNQDTDLIVKSVENILNGNNEKYRISSSHLLLSVLSKINEIDINQIRSNCIVDFKAYRNNGPEQHGVLTNPIVEILREEEWLYIEGMWQAPKNTRAYQLQQSDYCMISQQLMNLLSISGCFDDSPSNADDWRQKYEKVKRCLEFEPEEAWYISKDNNPPTTSCKPAHAPKSDLQSHKGYRSSAPVCTSSDSNEKQQETEDPAQFRPELARQLLGQSTSILRELITRNVLRTANSPTGDYGEWLISTALGLKLSKVCTKGYDAIDNEEKQIQIKSLRVPYGGREEDVYSLQLSAIRSLDEFDFLICVVFSYYYEYIRLVIKVPCDELRSIVDAREQQKNGYTNSYIFHVRDLFQCEHEILTPSVVDKIKCIDDNFPS